MGEHSVKLIHIPPQQLDPVLRDWLNGRGRATDKKRGEHRIVDPIGIDFEKKQKELRETTDWDDNRQHTENWS